MPFDEKKWGMTLDEAVQQLDEEMCLVEDGRVRCCIGLRGTLYFHNGLDPEVRKRMVGVFERYLKEAKDRLRWGADPVTFKPKKLAGTNILDSRTWLALLEAKEWSMVFHGGQKKEDANPYSLEGLARRRRERPSWITFTLPLSWLKGKGPAGFASLVLDCCRILRPYHGYAGLSVIQWVDEEGETAAMPHIQALAFRFHGLEVDFPVFHAMYLEKAIKGVNWLTILEDSWLPKVGGREKLEKHLGAGFVFHDYPGGVLVLAVAAVGSLIWQRIHWGRPEREPVDLQAFAIEGRAHSATTQDRSRRGLGRSLQRKSDAKRLIERCKLLRREAPHVIGERRLGDAHQRIAMDGRIVFQPFGDTDGDLGREAIAGREHRGADEGRETRLDERRPARHDEHARRLRIPRLSADTIQIASPQSSSWKASASFTSRLRSSARRLMTSRSLASRAPRTRAAA